MESTIITANTATETLVNQTVDSDRWGRIEVIDASHFTYGGDHFTYGKGGGIMFSARDAQGTPFIAVLPYGDRVRMI